MSEFLFMTNSPIPPKNPSVILVPQTSAITSYGLVVFRLIQNFFCLMESSEERNLLKQGKGLLPMGRRRTWAAFTLCDTLDFGRAIKHWRCFLKLKLPFFSCKWKVRPEVSHRPGWASIQGCVSWQRSGTYRDTEHKQGCYKKQSNAHPSFSSISQLIIPSSPNKRERENAAGVAGTVEGVPHTPLTQLWDVMSKQHKVLKKNKSVLLR